MKTIINIAVAILFLLAVTIKNIENELNLGTLFILTWCFVVFRYLLIKALNVK